VTPAELKWLHKYMLEIEGMDHISDEMRTVVEGLSPALVYKVSPKQQHRSKGGKHAKTVFGHLRHIYISNRELPGKSRHRDDAGCSICHARGDGRHRGCVPGTLPSWPDAPSILALRWLFPRICQSLVLPLLPPRSAIRLVTQQHIQIGLNGRPRWRAQIVLSSKSV
jgi:hypothetical protein